jgi:flagellar biosynthesis/type III secretory pathway protein FliH
MSGLPKTSAIRAAGGKDAKKQGYAKGMKQGVEQGMKQGEMSAAQMIAKRKDEAARRARGVM